MKSGLKVIAGVVAALTTASGASATTLKTCASTDITPGAQACVGFEAGNLLNTAHQSDEASALSQLGLTNWSGTTLDTVSSLQGATSVKLDIVLTGISYIGVHYGNGRGGPGEGTAFYRLDAGSGLSTINLGYAASSNLVVFATGALPEPGTWAMMVLGFGAVGATIRRTRPALLASAA